MKNNPRYDEIFEFIKNYIMTHGYSPSFREIGNGVRLKSTSSVNTYIKKLIDEGRLEVSIDPESDNGKAGARAFRLPGYTFVKEDSFVLKKDLEALIEKITIWYPDHFETASEGILQIPKEDAVKMIEELLGKKEE